MYMPKHYKISPSDMTFLYEECKHCFVNKVKYGIDRPSIPIPGIFSTIAALQKDYFANKRTDEFCPDMPPGKVVLGEKWVESKPIAFDGLDSTCFIKGRFDVVIELDDGNFLVGDFKTGNPSPEKSVMYGRQLHAYTYSLENPAEGALSIGPVTDLGLLFFTPDRYDQAENKRQTLEGDLTWIEVERNDANFLQFMEDVLTLLDGQDPPPDTENCDWCKYRKIMGVGKSESEVGQDAATPACPKCNGPMQLKNGKFGKFWSCRKFPECKGTRNP